MQNMYLGGAMIDLRKRDRSKGGGMMDGYREVFRCKECGKIYENGIPYICKKCGTEIGTETPIIFQALGHKKVTLTDNCEKVIAKKTLFGWKVKTG